MLTWIRVVPIAGANRTKSRTVAAVAAIGITFSIGSAMEAFDVAGGTHRDPRAVPLFGRLAVASEEADVVVPPTVVTASLRREYFRAEVPHGELIHDTSMRYGVDPMLVVAIVESESNFKRNARSREGARGLMQIGPSTARSLGLKDPNDPVTNVDAGVRYLKYLETHFGDKTNVVLAAYNAGEGAVRRHSGVPPYRETRKYVSRVLETRRSRREACREFAQARQEKTAR